MRYQNNQEALNSLKDRLRDIRLFLIKHETLFVMVLLLMVALLSDGLQLNEMGLYWDDWGVFWIEQHLGPEGLIDGHMIDRPALGYNHALLSLLFDGNIKLYHVYSFSLRLLGAYAFLWLLRLLWPDQRFYTSVMAVLFLVYPGFLSQPIAYSKSNHLTAFLLVIVSFALMVKAFNGKNRVVSILLWGLSLLTGAAYYFYFEYLLGFELARVVLLGYLIWRSSDGETKVKIVKFIKLWLPFLLAICVYLYWRIYVFESSRKLVDVNSLVGSYFGSGVSLRQYLTLFFTLLIDYLELIVMAWFVPAYHFITSSNLRPLVTALLLGGGAGLLVGVNFWVFSTNQLPKTNSKLRIEYQWVILGLATLIITNFLPTFAGRSYQVLWTYKSYGLHIAFPVSILLGGLLISAVRSRFRSVVVVVLVFLAVTAHNLNAAKMAEYWEAQKEFWWQVSWRIPDLKDGTVLWARLPTEYGFTAHFEIWSPLDFIYGGEGDSLRLFSAPLNKDELQWLETGNIRKDDFRGVTQHLDYQDSLVVSIPSSNSCLNVYDQNKLELSEQAEPLVQVAAMYSNLDQVILDSIGHVPPEEIFGPEPEHRWCYYYQKASLARQFGDWAEVIRLLDEAEDNGYRANDRVEWMPFFEAYVNLGMYKEARGLASIIKSSQLLSARLCEKFSETSGYPGEYNFEKVYELLCQ